MMSVLRHHPTSAKKSMSVHEDKSANHSVSFATYTQNVPLHTHTTAHSGSALPRVVGSSKSAPTSPKKALGEGRTSPQHINDDLEPFHLMTINEGSGNPDVSNKKGGAMSKKERKKAAKEAKEANMGVLKGGSGAIFNPEGADGSIIRSGHQEFNTLYASNDVVTGPMMVNVLNAPNNSTMQCGCENVNCPFCNLMLSIAQTDPSVLQ